LYQDLRKISPDAEAFLFEDVADGIKHFAAITGVKAETLPTLEEIEEIKNEENTLPPLDWMPTGTDLASSAITEMRRHRAAALLTGTGGLSVG
jgi:hypothetical protein